MKRRFCLQFLDCSAAEVAHAGTQSADELVDHGFERAAMGDAAFDAFGNELGEAILAVAFAGGEDGALGLLGASLKIVGCSGSSVRRSPAPWRRANPCRGRP